ncbi:integrin alpha-IIb-like [Homarus americanus]|uniref:integrin alpha-IIb-like n=1 Tax=Homarus americanus TaxID=6706 RepID=UPI001C46DF4C|nr:integrin alpha-IIb-like [Homarus americanus]
MMTDTENGGGGRVSCLQKWALWALWVVGVGGPWMVEGYNLSPSHSRIMEGPPGAHFGFSVALWWDKDDQKRIAVGAPRGKNSTLGMGQRPLGNIFLCTVTDDVKCFPDERLPMASKADKSEQALNINSEYMNKNVMGFGHSLATLKTRTSSLAACAPRYPRKEEERVETRGACFILDNLERDPIHLVPQDSNIPNLKTLENAMFGYSVALDDQANSVILGGPYAFYGEGVVYNKPFDGGLGSMNRLKDKKQQPSTIDYSDSNEGWATILGNFDNINTIIATSTVHYGNYTGRVSFYPKKLILHKPPLLSLYGTEVGAQFGYCLGSGDVDGDGAADLLVGAPLAPGEHAPDAGKIWVYLSPLITGSQNRAPQEVSGTEPWGRFGTALTSLGDANRDGYDDVAVAAPYAGMNGGGVVFVYYGGQDGLRTDHIQKVEASFFPDEIRGFGFSMDGGIDVDGNGYPDLIIGAVESDRAILVRSKPVIRLVGGIRFKKQDMIVEDEKDCIVEAAGYRSFKAVCFELQVDITYDTYRELNNLRLQFNMVLMGLEDTSQFGFKTNNDNRYTTERRVNMAGDSSAWTLGGYFKRVRANIGQTLSASVSVSLLSPPNNIDEESGGGDNDVVEPMLDIFTTTTYVANTTLICNNNLTCFSQPDLVLEASAPTVRLGENSLEVEVKLEAKYDPGYSVEVEVKHPELVNYTRVDGNTSIPTCRQLQFVNQISNKLICKFDAIGADEVVNFTLYFKYDSVSLLDHLTNQATDTLKLDLRVTSDSDGDPDTRNNQYSVDVPVVIRATLHTKVESLTESTTVVVNSTASLEELKAVKEDPQKTFPVDKLGPRLQHKFSLTNRGPSPVRNAKLKFHVPLYRSKGDLLTYFMDQPATSPSLTCQPLPINTLHLQPTNNAQPAIATSMPDLTDTTTTTTPTNMPDLADTTTTNMPYFAGTITVSALADTMESNIMNDTLQHLRRRRQVESTVTSQVPASPSPRSDDPQPEKLVSSPGDLRTTVQCFDPNCTFLCEVELMEMGSSVTITFTSYLVTATIHKMPYKTLEVKTWMTGEVDQENSTISDPKVAASTQVYLLRPPDTGFFAVPLWALLLAVGLAVLLIIFIITGLWMLGFFKRKRPYVEAKRQSVQTWEEMAHMSMKEDTDDG